ncbi:MAG: hypothetical protein AAF587_09225 [Bacteroidota bacterium]
MTQSAKMRGCLKILQENSQAFLVAWSPLTVKQFQDFFHEHTNREPNITLASYLNATSGKVYFLEHHPRLSKEQAMFKAIGLKEAVFLNAMDDPLMQAFNSARMINMMERMGVKEDEIIQHTMITKSIANAQKKLDEHGAISRLPPEIREWAESVKDY